MVLLLVCLVLAQEHEDEEEEAYEFDDFAAPAAAPARALKAMGYIDADVATLSATVGGAQDIGWFRDQVTIGMIPAPETYSAAGVLSEYDLVVRKPGPCAELLCVRTETHSAEQPIQVLTQLGFDTNLDANAYVRPPLDLTVVLDVSGSMAGSQRQAALAVVAMAGLMGPQDRLTVLTADSQVHERFARAEPDGGAVIQSLNALPYLGWSNLELGVREGLERSAQHASGWQGTSRVLVISDMQPTLANTDPQAFSKMARIASHRDVGMTWVGVAAGFDPAFANQVSQIRGGNSLYLPEPYELVERLREEFDLLVTPLAYDLHLEIQPASGWRLSGVYGIPGQALDWDSSGSAHLHVPTLFPSNEGGGIYLGFSREGVSGMPAAPLRPGSAVAQIQMAYTETDGDIRTQILGTPWEDTPPTIGWETGHSLVRVISAVDAALRHCQAGHSASALTALNQLPARIAPMDGGPLLAEDALVASLKQSLARPGACPR
jgi:Ca-activated chloride channel family protein